MNVRDIWRVATPRRRSEAVGVLTAQLTAVLTVGGVVDVARGGGGDVAAAGVTVVAACVVARLWADRYRFADVDDDPFPLLTARHPFAGFDPTWLAAFAVAVVAVFHPATTVRAFTRFDHPGVARVVTAVGFAVVAVIALR